MKRKHFEITWTEVTHPFTAQNISFEGFCVYVLRLHSKLSLIFIHFLFKLNTRVSRNGTVGREITCGYFLFNWNWFFSLLLDFCIRKVSWRFLFFWTFVLTWYLFVYFCRDCCAVVVVDDFVLHIMCIRIFFVVLCLNLFSVWHFNLIFLSFFLLYFPNQRAKIKFRFII